MCIDLGVKHQLFLSDFNETLIFLNSFFLENPQISNFMKIRPVGAELLHADEHSGQTWRS
jgi:hypothetical protein